MRHEGDSLENVKTYVFKIGNMHDRYASFLDFTLDELIQLSVP